MLVGEGHNDNITRSGELSEEGVPAAITDTGCERDLNEDRYAVIESPSGLAWLVCDGMGGVSGGELAAQLVIDAMRRDLENLPVRPPEVALRSAIQEANRIIVLRRQNPAFAQMGTTIVAAVFSGSEVIVGQVGDSRAYLIRDEAIQQLTTDHTYVQELVEKGQIRAEEALAHPQAHILTRCIGSEPALEIDIFKFWIWPAESGGRGDRLLLCTDGLYSLVAEGEVASIISRVAPKAACVQLVEMAKDRGGYDNITLAVIPLQGELRRDPPAGYEKKHAWKAQRADLAVQPKDSRSLWKMLLVVGMLSILSALLTVLFVTISVTR